MGQAFLTGKSGGGSITPVPLPPQVENFNSSSGNNSITITWTISDTTNLDDYVFTYKENSAPSDINDGTQVIVNKDLTSHTISGLTNDTLYFVRAFPRNSRKRPQTEFRVTSNTPFDGVSISTLPVGTKVKDVNTTYYGEPITWVIASTNHTGYPSNSVTLVSEKLLTIKPFDAKELTNPDSNIQNEGYNRYSVSNVRQWLNSNENSWYSPQHQYDASPITGSVTYNAYDTEQGFLTNFSQGFKNSLLNTDIVVSKNTVTDGGGSETVRDKVFLLSRTEVFGVENNGVMEGTQFPLFANEQNREVYLTQEAINNSEFTSSVLSPTLPWKHFLRTPNSGYSYSVGIHASNGTFANQGANNGNAGVRPVVNVTGDVTIKTIPDSDGSYIMQSDSVPSPLPPQVNNLTSQAGLNSITVSWNISDTFDLKDYIITYKQGSSPSNVDDGTKVTVPKTNTNYRITGLTNNLEYFIRIFPRNYDDVLQEELAVTNSIPVDGIPLNTLPVGTLVMDNSTTYYGEPIVWKVGAINHSGYPNNSITLVSDKILTLKPFDAKEPTNPDSNRATRGNNRYLHSNIHKWLNSNENSWYSPQHQYDAPPTVGNVLNGYNSYDTEQGFLTNFSQGFKNSLLNTNAITKRATVDGGSTETVKGKVFLLSTDEVSGVSGVQLPIFSDNEIRKAYPTQTAVENSEYTNVDFNTSSTWRYLLRDIASSQSDSYMVNTISDVGVVESVNSYTSLTGIRPALNTTSNVMVSPTPNIDGIYELLVDGIPTPLTPQVDNLVANPRNQGVSVSWNISDESNLSEYVLTYKEGTAPSSIDDGVKINIPKGTYSHVIQGLTNDNLYYARMFTVNTDGRIQDEYKVVSFTPREYVIYGVDIDESDSNPETSVTYTEMSVGFTPATNPSEGNFNYGSWEDKFPFNQIKPFAISHDLTEYVELNPNNFNQRLDGSAIDTTNSGNYNVMIRFPKIYWKIEKLGDIVSVKMSDSMLDETYNSYAHKHGDNEYEYIYLSAYMTGVKSINSVTIGKSQIGGSKYSGNLNTSRELVHNNKNNESDMFEITNYYQYQMLQVLYTIMFKNLNSQLSLSRGVVNYSTSAIPKGSTYDKGMYYGEPNSSSKSIKLFGIEDLWGVSYKWIEGLRIDLSNNLLTKNSNYEETDNWTNLGVQVPTTSAYMTKIQGGEAGFLSSVNNGSASTYYCDRQSLETNRYAVFSGGNTSINNAGIYNVEINVEQTVATIGNLFTHYKNQ